ncbi:unnamed protein product [Pleuronectes platessa]|uniref:Uncharacterized protein n=1 Tax=Pleuronectes platessa TaxID=8262 RepID=A0A9N7UYD2_PLEPL|nr:unnamed protein product [Pleuronectes platessa]
MLAQEGIFCGFREADDGQPYAGTGSVRESAAGDNIGERFESEGGKRANKYTLSEVTCEYEEMLRKRVIKGRTEEPALAGREIAHFLPRSSLVTRLCPVLWMTSGNSRLTNQIVRVSWFQPLVCLIRAPKD